MTGTSGGPPGADWDWDWPFPVGQPAAADNAGSVAAALFAGFSLTLIGLIVPDATRFRWPGVALVLLAIAAVMFIASVQCAFWAKEYAITPEDLTKWYPDMSRRDQIAYQRGHQLNFRRWAGRMNTSYRVGILTLLSGMAISLVPSSSTSSIRLAAVGVICLGLVAEVLWVLATWLLAGSPSIAFNGDPDEPLVAVRFQSIRRDPRLRRLARLITPLARIDVPSTHVAAAAESTESS